MRTRPQQNLGWQEPQQHIATGLRELISICARDASFYKSIRIAKAGEAFTWELAYVLYQGTLYALVLSVETRKVYVAQALSLRWATS